MIRPIDMQTMLMNLDKVGKDQAQARDNVTNQQAAEAQKLVRQDDQQTNKEFRQGTQKKLLGQKVSDTDARVMVIRWVGVSSFSEA